MLNFCIFVFIIYAVASSVRTILFGTGKKRKKRCKRTSCSELNKSRKTSGIIRLRSYQNSNLHNDNVYSRIA